MHDSFILLYAVIHRIMAIYISERWQNIMI